MVSVRSERSTRSSAIGTTSLMKPGLLPVPYTDDPPARHAASSCSTASAASLRRGWTSSTQVLTTFLPDARSRQSSSRSQRLGMWSTQSASSETSASTSSVAVTPTGVVPANVPMSSPTLPGS